MSLHIRTAVLGLCLLTISSIQAQISSGNSPYSRYGLGDPAPQDYAAPSAMGGVSGALYAKGNLNFVNPAAIGFLKYTVYDIGTYFQTTSQHEVLTNKDGVSNSGGLAHFALGFPINHTWPGAISDTALAQKGPQWGMAFSLQPQEIVGYSVAFADSLYVGQPYRNYIHTRTSYNGKGNHYLLSWANSLRFGNLSLGVSLGYYFGKTIQTDSIIINENDYSAYGYSSVFEKSQFLHAFNFRGGVMYKINLPGGKFKENPPSLTLSAYASGGTSIKSHSYELYYRYGSNFGRDTTVTSPDVYQSFSYPGLVGGGISYRSNTFTAAVVYEKGFWKQYSSAMENTMKIAAGVEWVPGGVEANRKSIDRNYLKKISYRIGAYYNTDPRSIQVSTTSPFYQLRAYAVTFGFGIPVLENVAKQRMPANVNVAFEIGKSGNANVIDQSFFRFSLGFSLNDMRWFIPRKFR